MATVLWIAAAIGLVVAAAIATSRARREPDHVASRGVIVIIAIAFAAIGASAIWVWGGSMATRARGDRLAAGVTVQLETAGTTGDPQRRLARAGDVMMLGDGAAMPGVARWNIGGRGAILAIPADPTDCAAWTSATSSARATPDGCLVQAGAYDIAMVPILPDGEVVVDRAARSVAAITGGPFLALLVLAMLPRRMRRAAHVAALARITAIGALLAALLAWRLAWAYRIDMLRELAASGPRVDANLVAAIAIGAALAASSALALRPRARVVMAVAAWIAWLAIGYASMHDLVPLAIDARTAGVLALAAFAAALPILRFDRRPPIELVSIAIAVAAIAAHAFAPRVVLLKLGLAYATVLAGYAALRIATAPSTSLHRRALVGAALAANALALALYDAGVAVAIAGTGLAIATITAGHDAAYAPVRANELGVLEREHARLVAMHAIAAGILAIALAALAVATPDDDLRSFGWSVAMHAPLALAALFVASAVVARVHRRGWLPWVCAALAALALWGARDQIVERIATGESVGARRVAAVVDPGYAILHDERAFAANVAAWREATPASSTDEVEGYFGARFRDPGTIHSIDNDYVAILLAREVGVGGLLATTALLFGIAIGAHALSRARFGAASGALRSRSLVATVVAVLVFYQPLAALGILPLTGIGWPGFAIDSPADLWIVVVGALWCACGDVEPAGDVRIAQTRRVIRAKRLVALATAVATIAATIVVARGAHCAIERSIADDARIDRAIVYAGSIACVDGEVGGTPTDDATTRFDRELRAAWANSKATVARDLDAHGVAFVDVGWPRIRVTKSTCTVERTTEVLATLSSQRGAKQSRIRVVATPIGIAASDAGELLVPSEAAGSHHRVIRLRDAAAPIAIADGVSLALRENLRAVVLRGKADVFVSDAIGWRRMVHADEFVLDRLALIVTGDRIALYRPTSTTLLADDADGRRVYPFGSLLPELGWVNPYDATHSVGLDGWIHAAKPTVAAKPTDVCTKSPLDGVTECRVSLQPELARSLAALGTKLFASKASPVRVAYVVMRGDTGEILAQSSTVAGRSALAYAPIDADAEAALVALRNTPSESDAERPEWNLPIAVGSTLKPIVARAAELVAPDTTNNLVLEADGHGAGCRARRGTSPDPIFGHCPPTSVAGTPTHADIHDFLARSPNWFEAALGIAGLALGHDAIVSRNGKRVALADLLALDVSSWSTKQRISIENILGERSVAIDPLRATPLWTQIERLLGRPLCTLGDRARCDRASSRADVAAARALPIEQPSSDLRYLVALGPSSIDLYADDKPNQLSVPTREYFQLLRGSGVHAIGSLAQLTDAFGRVIYGDVAASWFPVPSTGTTPDYTCGTGHARTVLGADGGLCGVIAPGGTGYTGMLSILDDPKLRIYGAKTGTIDSLADIARRPVACRAWNAKHVASARLACGATTPDDSLFVVAFGVVTPNGTIPITLGIQLQRAGKGAASRAAPDFMRRIRDYLTE